MTELACLPYGVGATDEGVCLRLQMGPYRILLDCGLSSVAPILELGSEGLPADVVLCTHAHADHAQCLLDLHRAFPQLPIYASEVTTQLLPLNWLDEDDVPAFCQALPWRSPIEFFEGLSVELFPAGHLPGAAACLLTYSTRDRDFTVFYTGDFFLSNSRLVDGMPLDELRGLRPDVLILEGSYGTARHPHRRQQENQLAERINQAIADQQSVLFPMPTLGLGQELLMLLRSHHYFTGRDVDIWVDEAIAAGCDAYLNLLPHLPSSVQNFARHQPLFWDERIRPRVRRLPQDPALQAIALTGQKPCIVLTHHETDLMRYVQLGNLPWLALLPQQPGRPGAIEAMTYRKVKASAPLQAAIQAGRLELDTYLLGEHCDGPSTTQLIHNLRPQHVVFVHGPSNYLADLTGLEELQTRYQLHTPAAGIEVELPVGETFLQPAAPDTQYEGEILELEHSIVMSLPDSITTDPRWHHLADTGIVEARWQGEALVIRGVPQRELLGRGREFRVSPEVECCENCIHCRGQRCWNQASPLYGFRVTPDGYCPVFEPLPELGLGGFALPDFMDEPGFEADDTEAQG
ncbi:MBL fold metallo-hydrolase [Leptolyngbya sp. AN02str]|uniref:MBL fold metallo-hydrolase n=1 Tax=Leptolyngbya sp. AN02str TaxID=3423363 RepID=UPI003D310256